MKIWRKLQKCVMFGLIAALLTGQSATAAERPSYTYTVTLSGGNRGTFSGTAGVEVPGNDSYQAVVEAEGSRIRITGLYYGDRITLNVQSGMVTLQDEEKYYIRGVRESGRDNSTVGNSSFPVDQDSDYVVAYGIKGNMVAYTVNYQDKDGKKLADSSTFYGVVGDKPVVAFRYIDGYVPQAYNLTKTLSSNEAENVFTFIYKRAAQTGGGGETIREETIVEVVPSNPSPSTGTAGTGTVGSTAGNGAGGEEIGDGGAGTDEENGGSDEPKELVELDDEKTPLANQEMEEQNQSQSRPAGTMAVFAVIAACALAGLILLSVILLKKKKARE